MNIIFLERTKVRFTKWFTKYEQVDAHELERILESRTKEVWKENATLLLRTLVSNKNSQYSKLRDLNMQVQGLSEKQPNEYVKWMSSGVHRQIHVYKNNVSCTQVKKAGNGQ